MKKFKVSVQSLFPTQVWVEMLALADLIKWCAADEAESVRSRLRGVVQRMAVSDEEVVEVLGNGVL